ncbi:BSD-domain-containing protein [Metschnikowia bicuspidata var. bicuspidata NRRL YB-4993]|uniref:BSD-domain-containing protein n=1 Tax=Metschnikowia bicuspidata var. bicuspidata NRRL YB-4993 TaxID=869754 RepID=A0A1A0HK13_9ASCO|nr:BSD-domain-containing protein [Metschnikowia bicuspidata var. bicuspidata NRRL YB-4993]OBA24519.1 BSD-domain-containing protein [Metschnikowia bicuspidata var. bicuspidata NRRL YB-4993]
MATVSGACVISKVSGLLQIYEDTTPSKLIWKAIDQDKSLEIPLNKLSKLQASPESSPKMLLRLFYQLPDTPDVKDLRLTFNNRQTMTIVKETLQTIVARQKTVIKDTPTPAPNAPNSANGTPTPGTDQTSENSPSPGDPLDFSSPQSLSDASLLKNRQLQQKLLLENKNLRNIFTQSVIKYKLSPAIFWSTRVGQLRTFALSICQHRGPYNVLSTIKPVATSDNQVNVNVTRDTIKEIFETYPIIRRACHELVPVKLNEGEFWSRFFNSKLFRRLRGDKINNTNTRGDTVIDRYLYVDADFVEDEEKGVDGKIAQAAKERKVNKFIDLLGNEVDNSQKLGVSPDFTMKFSDETDGKNGSKSNARIDPSSGKRENEMLVLMKNMNKLSSKMIGYSNNNPSDNKAEEAIEEMEKEVEITDLNDASEIQYIELNLDTHISKHNLDIERSLPVQEQPNIVSLDVEHYFEENIFTALPQGIDLSESYESRCDEINRANHDITALVKHNFRVFKLTHGYKDTRQSSEIPLLDDLTIQNIISFNITLTEFLLHFWNLFTNGGNPVQLKKLFTALRSSQTTLTELEKQLKSIIQENPQAKENEKLLEKYLKDLEACIHPLTSSLSKAINDYVTAVRAANEESSQENLLNENGKRPLAG